MADADFGIRGEATLDTSSAEKSATGLSDKLGDALDKSGQKMSLFASLGKKAADGLTVAIGNFETKIAQAAVQAVQQVVSTGLAFNRQMENYPPSRPTRRLHPSMWPGLSRPTGC